jgi:hypothetical protein
MNRASLGFPVSTQNHRYLRFRNMERKFQGDSQGVPQGESFSKDTVGWGEREGEKHFLLPTQEMGVNVRDA